MQRNFCRHCATDVPYRGAMAKATLAETTALQAKGD
jgi:hypothetical protein